MLAYLILTDPCLKYNHILKLDSEIKNNLNNLKKNINCAEIKIQKI